MVLRSVAIGQAIRGRRTVYGQTVRNAAVGAAASVHTSWCSDATSTFAVPFVHPIVERQQHLTERQAFIV